MDKFGVVPIDVQALLESVLKNYSIDIEDLYFKWESWGFRMGNNPPLDIEHVSLFKQDIQDQLEQSNQAKLRTVANTPMSSRKGHTVGASNGYDDFLQGSITPARKKLKQEANVSALQQSGQSSPLASRNDERMTKDHKHASHTPTKVIPPESGLKTPFANRKDPGSIVQSLDASGIDISSTFPDIAPLLVANFDPKKYSYRPMYQKLSEVSEILDDQIDQYADIILEAFGLVDEDIGDPHQTSQAETTVVGRIVCDALDGGRLNAASVLLETSRRLGTGSRTKLDLSSLQSYAFFPGQLVALKGTNGASEFKVSEIMVAPTLPPSASLSMDCRVQGAKVIVAAGPYTPNTDLSFEALKSLREVVLEKKPSTVILIGPFIDLSHPLISSGEMECQAETLDGVFQELISPIIKDFPGLLIIPHVNDAISRHPCFPQEPFGRQLTGLSKSVKLLPNPALFSLDEVSYGICSNDILKHLTTSEISRNPAEKNGLARSSYHIIQQRRFYPLFPGPSGAVGSTANLDMGFAGLTEFGSTLPDILISPSDMTTFVKVVNGVIVINPGGLSKKVGSGSYAQLYILPRSAPEIRHDSAIKQEHTEIACPNEIWKRSRVDIIRI